MDRIMKIFDEQAERSFGREGLERMEEVSGLPDVVPPVVLLPDFHFKKNMEAPSSIAVAVEGRIIPHLSSCSLNCGMGMIATGMTAQEIGPEVVGAFFDRFRRDRKNPRYDLTKEELRMVLLKGPRALQDKYAIADGAIAAFEHGGAMVDETQYSLRDVAAYIPDDLTERAEYSAISDLGVGFGGNHFLEIQKVCEIRDRDACRRGFIERPDEIVIMYHGGGGIVPGFVGGYFARRLKGYGNDLRLIYNKLRYHLPGSRGLSGVIDRYRYYFSPERFVSVPAGSDEGRRLALANAIAMNYGYAYRLIMFVRIADALSAVTGKERGSVRLARDVSHNSIVQEIIDGREVWVHRHNACRVAPGDITVLPGYNTTSSYVCVGGDDAHVSLYSTPHGAGDSIERYEEAGIAQAAGDRHTMIYRGEERTAQAVCQVTDEGVDAVVRLLGRKGIVRPVAKTTPLATLKDYN